MTPEALRQVLRAVPIAMLVTDRNARLVGAGVRVAGLTAERRTLEQVVLGLTGHGSDHVAAEPRGSGTAAEERR